MQSALRLSDLTRNALTLGAGTAAGQALVVLATPIWSRIYSSADFGRLGLLLSFLGAGMVGVALRYDLAIPLGRNREEASRLLVLSLLIIGPMSILLGMSLSVLCELGWLGFGELRPGPGCWQCHCLQPLEHLPPCVSGTSATGNSQRSVARSWSKVRRGP